MSTRRGGWVITVAMIAGSLLAGCSSSSSPGPVKLATQVSLIVADISAITAHCK